MFLVFLAILVGFQQPVAAQLSAESKESKAIYGAHTKIRKIVVAALEKEFGAKFKQGVEIEFGDRADVWLSIPADFRKDDLSNERIVAALEKDMGVKFKQSFQIELGPREDFWVPISSDVLKGKLSDDEIQAVAGKLMMIRFDILQGRFNREGKVGGVLGISISFLPGHFF
jgi:hypothetical protein